jgi:hypothetical protein
MTRTKSKSQSSSTTANAISKPKPSKLQDRIAELKNVNHELNGMLPCCLDPSTTLLLTSPTSEQTIRAHKDLTDANRQIMIYWSISLEQFSPSSPISTIIHFPLFLLLFHWL